MTGGCRSIRQAWLVSRPTLTFLAHPTHLLPDPYSPALLLSIAKDDDDYHPFIVWLWEGQQTVT